MPTTSDPTPSTSDDDLNPAADGQRHLWSLGDYGAIARYLFPISVETVDAAGVTAGHQVLDVATGDGNAAIVAAQRGATVTGIDLTPAQVELARARCQAEGLDVDLRVGDAQNLDVADASFDAVVSVMGAIFAPDHERALAEMARACRPGGTVALTAWANEGWFVAWRAASAHLVTPPPPGSPQPDAWGDSDETKRRFAAAGLDVTVEVRPFQWSFASVEECMTFFETSAAPFITFFEAMRAAGTEDEARECLGAALDEVNEATDGTCVLPSPFVLAVARR